MYYKNELLVKVKDCETIEQAICEANDSIWSYDIITIYDLDFGKILYRYTRKNNGEIIKESLWIE